MVANGICPNRDKRVSQASINRAVPKCRFPFTNCRFHISSTASMPIAEGCGRIEKLLARIDWMTGEDISLLESHRRDFKPDASECRQRGP
jgi:hypothetical protein